MQLSSSNQIGINNEEEIVLSNKIIIVILTSFIIAANLCVLLDVPILKQFMGYIYLTLIPGFVILLLFKNKYEAINLLLLSIGLSLSFVMILGFLTDWLFFSLEVSLPLSLKCIILSFNSAIFLMIFIIIHNKPNDKFILTYDRIESSDLAIIIIPTLFPSMAYIGTYFLKEYNSNLIIYMLVTIIILYILLIGLVHHSYSDLVNVYIIFLISFSLLVLIFFRTKYVYASDSIIEYNLFNQILEAGRYFEFRNNYENLGLCLSITILPTIYCLFIDLAPPIIFKLSYILPLSLTPVICYMLARKLLSSKYSFISSIFLISQGPFLYQNAAFRTYLSIFFFSMAILILLNPKIDLMYRRIIFLIFFFSGVTSHYSNTIIIFIILFILSAVLIAINHINKRFNTNMVENLNNDYGVTFSAIILYFTLIFLWYAQITNNAFNNINLFVLKTFDRLNQFLILESRSTEVFAAMGGTLGNSETPLISYINFIDRWLSILFIIIGIIFGIIYTVKPIKFILKPNFMKDSPEGQILILLSTICAFFFGLSVTTPFVFQGYSLGRTYYQIIVFLSIFFTIGGVIIANYLKIPEKSRHIIVLLVLIIYFANSLGILYELNERPSSRILNSPQFVSDYYYVYDTEEISANWMKHFTDSNTTYYADNYGVRKIWQLMLRDSFDNNKLFQNKHLIESGYIYLTYDNIVKKLAYKPAPGGIPDIINVSIFDHHIKNKNSIYSNGGASILW